MLIALLGVLLAGGAGAFTGLLIAYNLSGGPKYTAEIFGQSLPTLNTLGVFCTGLALGLIFCFGLWLIVSGTRWTMRRTTRRREARERPAEVGSPGHPQHEAPA